MMYSRGSQDLTVTMGAQFDVAGRWGRTITDHSISQCGGVGVNEDISPSTLHCLTTTSICRCLTRCIEAPAMASGVACRRFLRLSESLATASKEVALGAHQQPLGCDTRDGARPTRTTLYVVRHGETAWNVENRFQGGLDTELNHNGLAQAEEVGQVLASWPCDAVASSPLQRAAKTAAAIRGAHRTELPPIVTFAGLAECHAGWLQKRLGDDPDVRSAVEECEAQWTAGNLDCPYPGDGGESPAAVGQRARSALVAAAMLGEHVIVASHGMTLKCIAQQCLGCGWAELDLPITNCCVSTSCTRTRPES